MLTLSLDKRDRSAEVLSLRAIRRRTLDHLFTIIIETDYSLKIEDLPVRPTFLTRFQSAHAVSSESINSTSSNSASVFTSAPGMVPATSEIFWKVR
jgi:hypothetical protein